MSNKEVMSRDREDAEAAARSAYDEWKVGRCSYECAICGEMFPHSVKFYRHLSLEHPTVGGCRRYSLAHGCPRTRSHQIKCLACGEMVLYDYGELKVHFRAVPHTDPHLDMLGMPPMDVPQYFLLYVYGQESQKRKVADDAEEDVEIKGPTGVGDAVAGNHVDDGKCRRRKGNGLPRGEKTCCDKGESLLRRRHHRCLECGEVLLCDMHAVRQHLSRHGGTEAYLRRHPGISGAEAEEVEDLRRGRRSESPFGARHLHARRRHLKKSSSSTPSPSPSSSSSSSLAVESGKVANLCRFRCPLCGEEFGKLAHLYRHVNLGHKMKFRYVSYCVH